MKPLRSNNTNVSIVNPYVHLLGEDAAAIAYVKVVQSIDKYVKINFFKTYTYYVVIHEIDDVLHLIIKLIVSETAFPTQSSQRKHEYGIAVMADG